MPVADFDARGYWEQRLTQTYAIDGVGYEGLGPAFNTWMYRVRRHVFLRTLRRHVDVRPDLRVLDIGSGTGFYVDRWHELGLPAITGADLTDTAVEHLAARYPSDRFVRFDVTEPDPPLEPGSFDAISAIDVLFHVVDDERFGRAFETVFSLLRPGGVFVFSENFLRGGEQRAHHQVSRTLGTIEGAVTRAGFEIVERRPMFVLLNAPVDSRSPVLRATWQAFVSASARANALGGALGALAYPLELALLARAKEGPSTELMVCRVPGR
jgi:SAM-dependent methyltransferase